MGLDYDLIRKKKKMTVDNEERLNLLSKTYNDEVAIPLLGVQIIRVTRDYIGRPDLISLALYHDDSYADVICKMNGISNPFELNEGMEIMCPALSLIDQIVSATSSDMTDDLIEDDDQIVTNVAPTKKLASEKRSPNEATIGQDNYWLSNDNNFVIY